MIDCEDFRMFKISDNYADLLYQFTERVQQEFKIKPIIYTDKSFAEKHMDERFLAFPLAIQRFANLCNSNLSKPDLPKPWTDFLFWHYDVGVENCGSADADLEGLSVFVYNGDAQGLDQLKEKLRV